VAWTLFNGAAESNADRIVDCIHAGGTYTSCR
jgi:hypothetical protein